MATQLQIRRGTSTQVAAFTGAEGEIVVNTTNDSVHVNDGSTQGGFELARIDGSNWAITNAISTTNNISFGDNDKAIFGAGSDLQIYHDASDSIILDNGTGNLKIQANDLVLKNADGSKEYLKGTNGGSVRIRHNNTTVLETASTGINVTGSVGIGTSPSQPLHVDATGGTTAALFDNNGTNGDVVRVAKNGTDVLKIRAEGTADLALDANGGSFIFKEGGTERMRLTATGLGIGTSSLTNALGWSSITQVGGANPALSLKNSSNVQWDVANFGGTFVIYNGSNPRFKIDTSGNVLVGKTSADNTTQGIRLLGSAGFASFVRDGAEPIVVNRLTNDGDLIDFRKDGTTVGAIATTNSRLAIGSNDVGLFFDSTNERFTPIHQTNLADRDAAIDLGYASSRFKDLYLSGGVYLGGTGSANELSDYEEGAWTPSFQSFNGTFSTQSASYRKIGQTCFAWFHLDISSSHTGTNANLVVTGLPFSTQIYASVYGMTTTMHCNLWATANKADNGIMGPGSSIISFYRNEGQTGIYTPSLSDIGTGNFLCCLVFPTA